MHTHSLRSFSLFCMENMDIFVDWSKNTPDGVSDCPLPEWAEVIEPRLSCTPGDCRGEAAAAPGFARFVLSDRPRKFPLESLEEGAESCERGCWAWMWLAVSEGFLFCSCCCNCSLYFCCLVSLSCSSLLCRICGGIKKISLIGIYYTTRWNYGNQFLRYPF